MRGIGFLAHVLPAGRVPVSTKTPSIRSVVPLFSAARASRAQLERRPQKHASVGGSDAGTADTVPAAVVEADAPRHLDRAPRRPHRARRRRAERLRAEVAERRVQLFQYGIARRVREARAARSRRRRGRRAAGRAPRRVPVAVVGGALTAPRFIVHACLAASAASPSRRARRWRASDGAHAAQPSAAPREPGAAARRDVADALVAARLRVAAVARAERRAAAALWEL